MRDRRAREHLLLELFRRLVGEVPGDLGVVAGVVGAVGAGGGGVAAVVAPVEGEFREDADGSAAGGAERDGLLVFGLVLCGARRR